MKKSYDRPKLVRVELVPRQSVLIHCATVTQSGYQTGLWNCGGPDPYQCGPA